MQERRVVEWKNRCPMSGAVLVQFPDRVAGRTMILSLGYFANHDSNSSKHKVLTPPPPTPTSQKKWCPNTRALSGPRK